MTSRSRVHMLTVAAARLEQSCGNPKLIEDLKIAAKAEADRRAEGRDHSKADDKRIDQQRSLMAFVAPSGALDKLKAAMLQRAYDLMWDGDGTACDALCEFLPSLDVEAMFEAWGDDALADTQPKSKWYQG